MFLKRIRLKNYRRYRDEDIEFPTGITGIVGRNGSGKSTLIEAVGWCLYGNPASRTKKDQIKTTGIPESEDCAVTLEMTIGQDSVKITRELKGKNSSGRASVFVNGDREAHVRGMKEVSDFVAKRTGMDHVAFFTSVFAKQKELDSLSSMQPGERKKTVMRLLRIDRIEGAISSIRGDIKESKDRIEFLQGTLKDVDELENRSQQLGKQKTKTITKIKERTEKRRALSSEVGERQSEFSAHEKKYRDYNRIGKELVKTTAKKDSKISEQKTILSDLNGARHAKKRMKDIAPKVKEFESVNAKKEKFGSLHARFRDKMGFQRQHLSVGSRIKKQERLNRKTENKLTRLTEVEQELRNQQKAKSKLDVSKGLLTNSISAILARIKESEKHKAKLREELSEIENLRENGKCPICKRQLKDHLPYVSKHLADEILKLDEEISTNSKKANGLKRELGLTKKKISEHARELNGLEDKRAERDSLETELQNGKKTLSDAIKERTDLDKKLRRYRGLNYDRKTHTAINQQYSKLKKFNKESIKLSSVANRIPLLSKRYNASCKVASNLEHREKEQTKKLNSVGYDETEYNTSKKNLDTIKENYANVREDVIKLKGIAKSLDLQLKQTRQEISEEKGKHKEIDAESKKIYSRSKLEKIMNDFKLDLISRIRPILSQRSSELFRDITKGRYSSMELDGDYNIKIADGGASFATDRFSGGEEDLANLCLRIAISRELTERSGGTQSNFIALDEVFGSQDEQRKRSILSALSELSNQFKQILVITHVEDVKEMLPYVLTIKESSENLVKVETEGVAPCA